MRNPLAFKPRGTKLADLAFTDGSRTAAYTIYHDPAEADPDKGGKPFVALSETKAPTGLPLDCNSTSYEGAKRWMERTLKQVFKAEAEIEATGGDPIEIWNAVAGITKPGEMTASLGGVK